MLLNEVVDCCRSNHLGFGFQPFAKHYAANLISDGNDAYYNANC